MTIEHAHSIKQHDHDHDGDGDGGIGGAVARIIEPFRHDQRIPGLSIAIADSSGLRHASASGLADLRRGQPATPETSYLWFSLTKIVTATAAVRLADEGRLDLDEPIARYFPTLSAPRSSSTPRVGQLLNHTAGVTNPLPLRWVRPAAATPMSSHDFVARILGDRKVVTHPVGATARYSNLGYLLLGEIISAASGKPFESYVQDTILEPCGMNHTGFVHHQDREPAVGYVRLPRALGPVISRLLPPDIVGDQHGRHRAFRPFYVEGASYGGLVGDVVDASRIISLHLGDGTFRGRGVMSAPAARRMRQISTTGRTYDLGQGWYRSPEHRSGADTYVEHLGGGGGFFNVMRIYPENGVGVVMMSNTTTRFPHHHLLEELRRVASPR